MEVKIEKRGTGCLVIKSQAERLVSGIVYHASDPEAPEFDAQGDTVDAVELWKALKSWMIDSNGRMKIMHKGKAVYTPIVENYMATSNHAKDGVRLRKGDWFVTAYVPPEQEELWQAIQKGEIGGFSIGGKATAVDVEKADDEPEECSVAEAAGAIAVEVGRLLARP